MEKMDEIEEITLTRMIVPERELLRALGFVEGLRVEAAFYSHISRHLEITLKPA